MLLGPGGHRFQEVPPSEGSRLALATSGGKGTVPRGYSMARRAPGEHRQVLGLTSAFLG